ncbi:MAG: hypothetical protein PHO20_05715 [Candidatus Peribacteraceae bacterium]|nr:hypothetical protein [Candidatus Peribacteraceae bacterium]MDD5740232.1 hypothetical protein [Candidatus Peribacteraceae bacterium]
MSHRSNFSLTRFIVLIALAAIAMIIIFILADPARRIRANRNARRAADVTAILNAVQAYQSAKGTLPPGIDTDAKSVQIIGAHPGDCAVIACPGHALPEMSCTLEDLEGNLQPFLGQFQFPTDPKTGTDSDSRYFINQDARHAVTVGACDAETEDLSNEETPPAIEVTQ